MLLLFRQYRNNILKKSRSGITHDMLINVVCSLLISVQLTVCLYVRVRVCLLFIAAAQEGHEEVARLLLASGADPNRADGCGRTALKVSRRSASLFVIG